VPHSKDRRRAHVDDGAILKNLWKIFGVPCIPSQFIG
jgi:hypothetical protein